MKIAAEIRNMMPDSPHLAGLTKLHNNFTEVIRMPRPTEEADIADCTIMLMFASEDILLDVGNTLHDEPDRPKDNTSYIPAGSKLWLILSLVYCVGQNKCIKYT